MEYLDLSFEEFKNMIEVTTGSKITRGESRLRYDYYLEDGNSGYCPAGRIRDEVFNGQYGSCSDTDYCTKCWKAVIEWYIEKHMMNFWDL